MKPLKKELLPLPLRRSEIAFCSVENDYPCFHSCTWNFATAMLKRLSRFKWYIRADETFVPFFGKRQKLNEELIDRGEKKPVHGHRAKTPGATGSFCFLVLSLCCCRIRIPIAVKMLAIGESCKPWLKPILRKLLKLCPRAIVLADRGFGKATWFHRMLDELNAKRIIRIPLRARRLKKKIANGQKKFQYRVTDSQTKEKALLNVRIVYDKGKDPLSLQQLKNILQTKHFSTRILSAGI